MTLFEKNMDFQPTLNLSRIPMVPDEIDLSWFKYSDMEEKPQRVRGYARPLPHPRHVGALHPIPIVRHDRSVLEIIPTSIYVTEDGQVIVHGGDANSNAHYFSDFHSNSTNIIVPGWIFYVARKVMGEGRT